MYQTRIKGKKYSRETLSELSALYQQLRDQSGLGVSKFPGVDVIDSTSMKKTARISYNGRVWDNLDNLITEAVAL